MLMKSMRNNESFIFKIYDKKMNDILELIINLDNDNSSIYKIL